MLAARVRREQAAATSLPTPASLVVVLAVVLVAAMGLRMVGLDREGFSIDEEITVLAARGIGDSGMPHLPSGVLYSRGLPFTYAGWVAGRFAPNELLGFRLVSLISAGILLLLVFKWSDQTSGRIPALGILILLAASQAHIAEAKLGRAYALFALLYLSAVVAFCRAAHRRELVERPELRWAFFGIFLLASLCYEAAYTLVALPLFVALESTDRKTQLRALAATGACAAIVLVIHYLPALLATPFVALPDSVAGLVETEGGTAVYGSRMRTLLFHLSLPGFGMLQGLGFLDWTLVLMPVVLLGSLYVWKRERSLLLLTVFSAILSVYQLGIVLLLVVALVLIRPKWARQATMMAGIAVVGYSLLWSYLVAIEASMNVSPRLFLATLRYGLSYPTAALSFYAEQWTIVALTSLIALVACLLWPQWVRLSRLSRIYGWLLLADLAYLGILRLYYFERHFTFVLLLNLLFLGHFLHDVCGQGTPRRKAVAYSLAAVMLVAVGLDDWQLFAEQRPQSAPVSSASIAVPPTFVFKVEPGDVETLRNAGILITNDEIFAALEVRRPDYWLVPGSRAAENYTVYAAGRPRGLYAGSVLLFDPQACFDLIERELPERTIAVLYIDSPKYRHGMWRKLLVDLRAQYSDVARTLTGSGYDALMLEKVGSRSEDDIAGAGVGRAKSR